MDSPIFLLGAHKSGTSLLRSLFDGHPNLYVVPFETHIFNHLGYPVSNPYFENTSLSNQISTNNFFKHLEAINQSNDPYADSININRFDLKKFKASFYTDSDLKSTVISYLESIQKADSQNTFNKKMRVVEKSVTHHEYALELSLLFPNAKFIHLIRNPYANWVALRKYKSISKGGPLLYRVAKTFQNNFYFLERNKRSIKNYHVLKYEDLVSNTEHSLNTICKFLDLEFTPSLLTPTKNGDIWKGNSTSDKKFNSVNADNLNRWKSSIHPVDIFYVNQLFSPFIKEYDYPFLDYNKGFYNRLPKEGLVKYIMNRFYRLYIKDYTVGKD